MMGAETKVQTGGVHRKLVKAREAFHALKIEKSGKNTFAGYSYFELGDFLVPGMKAFHEAGLSAAVSFTADLATMTIVDLDNPEDTITITSPMGSAALKGCHEVQNIGAVETYQRRYLWVAALEIVEHDALDATTGKDAPEKKSGVIDAAKVDLLQTYASGGVINAQRFCRFFEIDSFKDLPADRWPEAEAMVKAKQKVNA